MYGGGIGHKRWPTCGSAYPSGRRINFVTIDTSVVWGFYQGVLEPLYLMYSGGTKHRR